MAETASWPSAGCRSWQPTQKGMMPRQLSGAPLARGLRSCAVGPIPESHLQPQSSALASWLPPPSSVTFAFLAQTPAFPFASWSG